MQSKEPLILELQCLAQLNTGVRMTFVPQVNQTITQSRMPLSSL